MSSRTNTPPPYLLQTSLQVNFMEPSKSPIISSIAKTKPFHSSLTTYHNRSKSTANLAHATTPRNSISQNYIRSLESSRAEDLHDLWHGCSTQIVPSSAMLEEESLEWRNCICGLGSKMDGVVFQGLRGASDGPGMGPSPAWCQRQPSRPKLLEKKVNERGNGMVRI